MPQLEFKYSADQPHQVNAVNAVCDLFRGQEFISEQFTAGFGRRGQPSLDDLTVGHANGLHVSAKQLLENLHRQYHGHKTMLFISHREAAVRFADHTVTLKPSNQL